MLKCLATALLLALSAVAMTPQALAGEDGLEDLVRLPGQGLVKPDARAPGLSQARLVPGGGLFASFDIDGDGAIFERELSLGILAAFATADRNGDKRLTALEQQAWAAGLPTRDDTLSNPVRFDPNLDRIVTEAEFDRVVRQLAAAYSDGAGTILLSSLTAPEPPAIGRPADMLGAWNIEGRAGVPR